MFTCQSYLLKPGSVVTPDNLENNLVDINNLGEISSFKSKLDLFYLEGAISLKYYDVEILGKQHWDLIDQLWSYLIEMIRTFKEEGKAEVYFPDQPIRLEMSRISDNQILFSMESAESSKWNLPEKEFFSILLDSASDFYNFMIKEFPETIDEYKNELERIEEFRSS